MTHHKCNSCQGPIVFLQTEARPALRLSTEGKDCEPTTILKRQDPVGGLPLLGICANAQYRSMGYSICRKTVKVEE